MNSTDTLRLVLPKRSVHFCHSSGLIRVPNLAPESAEAYSVGVGYDVAQAGKRLALYVNGGWLEASCPVPSMLF